MKLAQVAPNRPSESVPGAYFAEVTFERVEEYVALAAKLEIDVAAGAGPDPAAGEGPAQFARLRPLIHWLFLHVLRDEKGEPFDEAESEEAAGQAPILTTMALMGEFSEGLRGNLQAGAA